MLTKEQKEKYLRYPGDCNKIRTLAVALKHFDLDRIYVRPVIRKILDRIPEQKPFGNACSRNSQQMI